MKDESLLLPTGAMGCGIPREAEHSGGEFTVEELGQIINSLQEDAVEFGDFSPPVKEGLKKFFQDQPNIVKQEIRKRLHEGDFPLLPA